MNLEETVKSNLLTRGFSKETQLNNRGLIGATIDETALTVVKNLTIPVVTRSYSYGELKTAFEQARCNNHSFKDWFDFNYG